MTERLSTSWEQTPVQLPPSVRQDVTLECGWGRLVFGQTFTSQARLEQVLRAERAGRRDICIYPRDPHVLVARAPQELFVDPSHTFRLAFSRYQPAPEVTRTARIRPVADTEDVEGLNEVYAAARMLRAAPDVVLANARSEAFTYLVATDAASDTVVGTVTGVDHVAAFGDPEGGTSLWCLAVDPQYPLPSVGEALVRTLVEQYQARGRRYLDLSVLHDNARAIRLYERLGFTRVPVLTVKRKNPINEPLFVGPPSADYERLNPYARIIADEARRRGIIVDVLDAEWGELRLSHGGRSIVTRESLSELTSAVAMSRCDDKRITRRICEARRPVRAPRPHRDRGRRRRGVPARGRRGGGEAGARRAGQGHHRRRAGRAGAAARDRAGPPALPHRAARGAGRGRGPARRRHRPRGRRRRGAPARVGHRRRAHHRRPAHHRAEPAARGGDARRELHPARRGDPRDRDRRPVTTSTTCCRTARCWTCAAPRTCTPAARSTT